MKYSLTILLLFVFAAVLHAQDEEEVNVIGFRFLDYKSGGLPEDLLKTKSVVFVGVPTVSKNSSERGDWKKLAREAHPTFKSLGIDAVKYYSIDDALSGGGTADALAAEMAKREISNVIILSHVAFQIKNKDAERHVMIITPFNGKSTFMDNGQVAWKTQDKDLDKALKSLTKDVSKLGNKENLLINDVPEFGEEIKLISGRRNESFNTDLRIDKLAVPKFATIEVPANAPGGVLNNSIKKEAENYNKSVPAMNKRLEQFFADYPYNYALVEPNETDASLRSKGFHYRLEKIQTSGESVKLILGYETDDIMDDYVTVKQAGGKTIFRSIPKKAPVYKYYIRHIHSGDVYLGSGWDADETWYEALENHLDNLLRQIEKKD